MKRCPLVAAVALALLLALSAAPGAGTAPDNRAPGTGITWCRTC